jgi:hypothetical protein
MLDMADKNTIRLSKHHFQVLSLDSEKIINDPRQRYGLTRLYGQEFLENIDSIIERLRYPKTRVIIVDGPDDICEYCHDGVRSDKCDKPVPAKHRSVPDTLGIETGMTYSGTYIAALIL